MAPVQFYQPNLNYGDMYRGEREDENEESCVAIINFCGKNEFLRSYVPSRWTQSITFTRRPDGVEFTYSGDHIKLAYGLAYVMKYDEGVKDIMDLAIDIVDNFDRYDTEIILDAYPHGDGEARLGPQ